MYRKMFLLFSAVLVLTLIDTVWADPCDANLVGWWKFDEGAGTTVVDSSAYGNDGVTTNPAPTWVGGCPIDPCDSGMYFDGSYDNYVLCAQRDGNTYPAELMPDTFTISCWIKLDEFTWYGAFVSNGADGECGFFLQHGGNGNDFGLSLFTEGVAWSDVETPTIYDIDLWYHLAATYDGQYVTVYIDGDIAQGPDGVSGPMRWIRTGTGYPPDNFVIGSWEDEWSSLPVHGTIDEVRFYNYAMPQSDIKLLAGFVPGAATNPSPRRGAKNVSMNPTLSWTAGTGATAHAVYFGTNSTAVNNATTADTTGIYKGTQAMPDVNCVPGALALNTNYYWRIDAIGPNTVQGRVWSFIVAPFNLVDDFESYTSHTTMRAAWNDYWYGPGHQNHGYVYKNTDANFSRDGNSMMFTYENATKHSGVYYGSWATGLVSKIPVGNDWTAGGAEALVLYFYGNASNSKTAYDKMYIKLTDGAAHTGILRIPDMNDVAEAEWHEWNIELADPAFSTVVKTNVTSIRIGFGGADGGSAGKGGSGTMYFDDIRLWPPRCRPEIAYPYGDASGDCSIDGSDIGVMSDDWLATDANILATAPPDANLIGWWKFDEGEGNTVDDSSAYNNTGGSESATPPWTTGYPYDPCNCARYFDGLNNYYNVVCAKRVGTAPGTYPAELMPGKFTISVWAKFVDYDEEYAGLVTSGIDGECGFFLWNCTDSAGKGTGDFGLSMMTAGGWQDIMPPNVYPANTWNHVAVTYDGQYGNFYVNGIRTAGPQDMYGAVDWLSADGNYPSQFVIGAWEDPWYESLVHGSIDEVRYYNYALPQAQIAVLAGLQGSIYLPLESLANFVRRVPDPDVDPNYYPNNPDIVNFLDYHVIAENWLNQILWP